MYPPSIFMCQKHGRSDVPIIFPLLPQSIQRKPPERVCHSNERKKIGTGKSKAPADAVGEEVNFLWTCQFR